MITLDIPFPVFCKFAALVEVCPYEISALGKVEKKGNDLKLTDIKLFRQQVGYSHTVIDRRDLGRFYYELMQKEEDVSQWKCWLHSHADFAVFWSATDEETIKDFDNDLSSDNWMLSIVMNKKKDLLARVDTFAPFQMVEEVVPHVESIDRMIFQESLKEAAISIFTHVTPPNQHRLPPHVNGFHNKKPTTIPVKMGEETVQIILPGQ